MSKLTQDAKTPQDIFLKELRTQTHESHQSLEDNKISIQLLSEAVSVKDYQNYLGKMYGLKLGIERNVYPLLKNIFSDLEKRKKAHLIKQDLLATGMDEKEIDAIPVKNFTPTSANEALGIMYVLEGSSLGGRFLYKHVNKMLGLSAEKGAAFFNGYGDETGSMWKIFVSIFTEHAINDGNQQEVISAAKDTFDAVGKWLSA